MCSRKRSARLDAAGFGRERGIYAASTLITVGVLLRVGLQSLKRAHARAPFTRLQVSTSPSKAFATSFARRIDLLLQSLDLHVDILHGAFVASQFVVAERVLFLAKEFVGEGLVE